MYKTNIKYKRKFASFYYLRFYWHYFHSHKLTCRNTYL